MRTLAQRLGPGTATLLENRAALAAHVVDRMLAIEAFDGDELSWAGGSGRCERVRMPCSTP
ncbi:hypothetical protein SGRIM119S_02559 [Streptomyces griseorubiginosus]